MLNNDGFSLIEVLIATSIIFMLLTTIIPLASLLEQERTVLGQRRTLSAMLHDELQPFLWGKSQIPATYSEMNGLLEIRFKFVYEGEYVKGCVNWENARKKNETICLYGYQQM